MSPKRECWVERCTVPARTRGLCQWHYERQHRYKDFAALAGPRPPRPACSECGKTLRNLNATRCAGCRPEPLHPPHWVNPLVCVCAEPDADPARDFGMCRNAGCKRKPLALMAVAS